MSYGKKVDLPSPARVDCRDIWWMLKDGRLEEYVVEKEKRISKWKSERYRVCVRCGSVKLAVMFEGESASCRQCLARRDKDSKKLRRDYHKEYNRGNGLQQFCAKQIVYNMKKMGILEKGPCEICGDENSFSHHDDYNEPWKVRWMCRQHHMEWHRNNKPRRVGGDG